MSIRGVLKISSLVLIGGLSASLLAAVITNLAPTISTKPYPVAELGQTYQYAVRATDPEGNDVAYSVTHGPSGMAYSEDDQAVKWTPQANQIGLSQVTVRASDSWGASADQNYTLRTVADYCEIYPITIPDSLVRSASVGDVLENIERGTGPGNFSFLTWAGENDAPTLAKSLEVPGNSYNYINPDNAQDILIEIGDWTQGSPGSMNSAAIRHNLDILMTRDIIIPSWNNRRAQGSKFDYRVAQFPIVRLKSYRLTGNGWLTFELKGFKDCYNDAPVALNQNLTTPEDQALPITLQAQDPENDALSYTVLQQPAHGRLEGSGQNLAYIPNANYNGLDSFTFKANDGEFDSNIATVLITVTPINDPPTARDLQVQTDEDVPVPVTLQGQDPENDVLSYHVVGAPLHGTLSGAGAALIYQPSKNYHGTDRFTYRVNDGELDSPLATVDITVIERNAPPVAQNLQYTVKSGIPLNIALTGSDPDGDDISFSVLSAPGHGQLSGTAPALNFVSEQSYAGTLHFTYLVNDGRLDSAIATVTITVISDNHPPKIISVPNYYVQERATYFYDIDAIDPDVDDVLTYTADRTKPSLVVAPQNGYLNWSALNGTVGSVREKNLACRTPAPRSTFDPVLKWGRGTDQDPEVKNVIGPALVAQLTDDNGDGKIDINDKPDVVVQSRNTLTDATLIALHGETGATIFTKTMPYLASTGTPAIGDLDGDGLVEIAVLESWNGGHMSVFENDGTLKWRVAVPEHSYLDGFTRDSIAIADLDADGSPELIRGATIVNGNGTVRCTGTYDKGGTSDYAYSSIVADVDMDGKQEVLAGRSIYDSQCNLKRQLSAAGDGFVAVGNFDSDKFPEIVLVSNGSSGVTGRLYIFKHTGARLVGPVAHPGGGALGPPTLANVDNDPYPEIAIGGKERYAVFDNNGTVLWSNITQDYSSHQTGSTFFDFEGDGAAEVVYNDEINVYFWDGRTGALRYSFANTSGTTLEYPVIADIDGDHSADVIMGFNGVGSGGLRIISSSSGSWSDARPLWNQHAFSITNINDDGTIPARPEPSWLVHNTYRLNALSRGQSLGQPDLALFDLRLDTSDQSTLRLTAINRGLADTSSETIVRFYDGTNNSGRLLGSVTLPIMETGKSINVSLTNVDAKSLGENVYAVVDDLGAVTECVENNNGISAQVFNVRATDLGGLYDRQVFTVGVTDVNDAPIFKVVPIGTPHMGQLFTHRVVATDADIGDGLIYSLISGPTGMTIEPVIGELRWLPANTQAGSKSVTVKVTDLRGLSATQTLTVTLPANNAPVISSTPVVTAVANQQYKYDVNATDADGDLISYSLTTMPIGMIINGATGVITWTPTFSQVGANAVVVKVYDPYGGSVTQSFTVTVTLPENHAPTFTTTPVTAIALGQRYQYDSRATDSDGDELRYSLLDAPLGMAIDTVTGTIVWQPRADQVGAHDVSLQVIDPRGATDAQTFTIYVSKGVDSGNHPPSIDSSPETKVLIGQTYLYNLMANDIDSDTLSYELQSSPAGMTINSQTGQITWTPTTAQLGLSQVSIVVSDDRGATATQSFSILASTVPTQGSGNRPPAITSEPLTLVTLGQTYRYYIAATDPDGDPLNFVLTQAPAGMAINASGVIVWTPNALGPVTVSVQVSDGRGASVTQSFTVNVVDTSSPIDHRPVLLEVPFGQAKVDEPYSVQVQAVDADGDTMTYTLISGPDGAVVNANSGQVSWTPTAEGTATFVVRISSGNGYTDVTWTVQIVPADMPLSVQVQVTPERVLPGAALTVSVAIEGASGPVNVQATLSGNPLVLEADGTTSFTAPTGSGHYLIVVTVDDGNTIATDSVDIYVADPRDTVPPVVDITSPDIDARITAPTSVSGKVDATDVVRWTLTAVDKVSLSTTQLAEGQASVQGVLGQFDPTLLNNGFYTLVLQAWDAGGNRAQDTTTVLVDGDMKLGHYSVTFEDVSIPMAGIPLRVTRTYDTRRRNDRLDFGYGWSVDYQNVRISESRRPGFSWVLEQERNGFFANWCVRPNGDPIVAVSLPDGELMKFRAKASPECQFLVPQTDVQLVFEPLPGTDAQLEQTDFGSLRLATLAGSNVYHLMDLSDPDQLPVDSNHYRLKLPSGMVYSLTQGVGINTVTDPDGNTLTYTRDGVKHSLGQEVKFVRDTQGRIQDIVLPDGRHRPYTYTAQGDLEMTVDTGGDITSFAYLARAPHYLKDIIDPRGIRVSRNEYDDDGRLVATIDAEGHRIEYTHNMVGRTEIVRDRRGYATTYAYDLEGRVTAESNALGETTLHSYDANGNELSTTNPLNHTTVRTFDARGNQLTETNALLEKTTRTYNTRNNLLTEVNALGHTVSTNSYNSFNGQLVMTKNALGNITSFVYDSGIGSGGTGELLNIVDAANQQNRFTLNTFGHRKQETDALGNVTSYSLDSHGRVLAQHRTRTRSDGSIENLYTRYTLDAKGRVMETEYPDGSSTTTEYDGNDKPVKTCDAISRCTTQKYDDRGNLVKTTYPDTSFESSHYDENGNVDARTDRAGRTTKMVYDKANRLLETILPDNTPNDDTDNARIRNEYDDAGRLVASINERNARTTYGYDDAGRRTTVTDALHHTTTTVYNDAGQRVAVIDALGHTTRFVYDLAGRLTDTIHPDETADLDDNPRTTIVYDEVGRKLAEIDEMGRRKNYKYDLLGRIIAVTLPNPNTGLIDEGALVTRFVYDEVGNKLEQIDALGRTTRWTYDSMGRELSRTLPLGQTERFEYDEAGQRVAHTDFKGVTTRYKYDDTGRMTLIDYATDTDVVTGYTASGQRETVTDAQGTTRYAYDVRDRLLSVSTPDGQVINYAYDAAGNRTELHSAALDQIFEFDDLNRLTDVHSQTLGGAVRTISYGYDDVGNRVSLQHANGTVTSTVFDNRHRLKQLLTRSAAGVLLFGANYTVDASGLRLGIGEYDQNGVTRSVGYGYDGTKRLLAEAIGRPGQALKTTTYEFDAVGNRLSKNNAGEVTRYEVDANDRLLKESIGNVGTLYSYDENGNTLSQTKGNAVVSYGYNQANRLVSTTTSLGIVTTSYNADGIRNRQTINNQTSIWLIDPNRDYAQTLEAYTNNQLRTVWLYGDSLLAQSTISNGASRETSLHTDGLGSVRQASNSSASVTDSFEYDAFGNELNRTGTTDIDHRYRNEQLDSSTGFYNLRARWYDPSSGRFTSQDSWLGNNSDPISLHKYLYANADPVNNFDPSGYMTLGELSIGINTNIRMQLGSTQSYKFVFQKCGCALVEYAVEEAISSFVYVFIDELSGKPYVGKTVNGVDDRLGQHKREYAKNGRRKVGALIAQFNVIGDKDDLQLVEQLIYDVLSDGDKTQLSNVNRPLSNTRPSKAFLRERLKNIKFCK